MTFATVLVRQGHPGPRVPPYTSVEGKRRDALAHAQQDGIPWPVLVDDLPGTVHRTYGQLADPTYLIDRGGYVSFYQTMTHAPTLHRALLELSARGGRGVVGGGVDRRVHALPIITAGWPALQRGLWQSVVDLETAAPGAAVAPVLGYLLKRWLAPLTLRDTPLPPAARVGLAAAALAAVAVVSRAALRSRRARRVDALAPARASALRGR